MYSPFYSPHSSVMGSQTRRLRRYCFNPVSQSVSGLSHGAVFIPILVRLDWSEWIPLVSPIADYKRCISRDPGLYHVKIVGQDALAYVGQTGRDLRERTRALAAHVGRPADDPPPSHYRLSFPCPFPGQQGHLPAPAEPRPHHPRHALGMLRRGGFEDGNDYGTIYAGRGGRSLPEDWRERRGKEREREDRNRNTICQTRSSECIPTLIPVTEISSL